MAPENAYDEAAAVLNEANEATEQSGQDGVRVIMWALAAARSA